MIIDEAVIISEGAGFEDIQDLALENAVEVERSFGEMMLTIAKDEFKSYQESGSIEAVNEGAFQKVKEWAKKIWEKIKNLFSRVVAKIRSWFSSSSKFYEKYHAEIEEGIGKVKDFKGYKYTKFDTETITSTLNASYTFLKDVEGTESITDKNVKKAIFKIITRINMEGDDFSAALKKFYRGSTDKTTITMTSDEIKNLLKDSNYTLKLLKNAFSSAQIAANKIIADFDKEKDSKKITVAKSQIGVLNTACTIIMSLATEQISQAKAYASAAVQAGKKGSTNESADVEDFFRENGIEF